ncbi:MAG: MFS transporter [Candidatus Bathyarchaeia archaeon]
MQFLISRTESVYILLMVALLAVLGSFIPAKLKHKISSKSLTVISIFGNGICSALLFLAPSLWIALFFNFSATVFITVATSAYHCLILEQVPRSRGITMSLFRTATGTGCIVAPALAGILLVTFSPISLQTSYIAAGVGLCILNMISACILHFFSKEILYRQ